MSDQEMPWWAQSSIPEDATDRVDDESGGLSEPDPWEELANLDEEDIHFALDHPAETAHTKPTSRDDALDGPAPLVLVHRPRSGADQVPPLLRAIRREQRSDLSLGVVAPLSRLTPGQGTEYLDRCAVTSPIRIADPVSFSYFDTITGRRATGDRYRRWQYQKHIPSLSTKDIAGWVSAVLQAQRDAGATVLLTPGRWMPGTDPAQELDTAFTHTGYALNELTHGERLGINLTLAATWLSHEPLLGQLLQRIVESEHDLFYVRVLWPLPSHAYALLNDPSLLAGYRELCTTARNERLRLLLPETDLVGWLALAWGAIGFGTGISSGDRAFAHQRPPSPTATARPRYFEPQLLHTILYSEHEQLRDLPEYQRCNCTYCTASMTGTPWSQLQALHHVAAIGQLTADVHRESASGVSRFTKVLATVQTGQKLAVTAASNQVSFTKESYPVHLPTWEELLNQGT